MHKRNLHPRKAPVNGRDFRPRKTTSGISPTLVSGDRYSPLRQITTENVSQLKQVCTFDTDDTVSFQSGLVIANGTLYATAFQNTYAIDPTTCAQKWRHSRSEPPTYLHVNRGVGFAENRVFRGTGDAHVVAIDATNGRTVWDIAIGDTKLGESAPMRRLHGKDVSLPATPAVTTRSERSRSR